MPGVVHGRRSQSDSGWLELVDVHKKFAPGPTLCSLSAPFFSSSAAAVSIDVGIYKPEKKNACRNV